MANKMKEAKKRVHKNDKTRFERVVRHRQVLEREKYVEKAVARTCNIYFICAILAFIFVIGMVITIFVTGSQNMLLLGLNVAVGVVFIPLCLYQYNQYHHIAEEVANARLSSGFRFPEDYTPRTRQAREAVAGNPDQYTRPTLLYLVGLLIIIGVTIFLVSTGRLATSNLTTLLLALIIAVVAVVLLVLLVMSFWNYLDAKALRRALIQIEKDAEIEFSQQLERHAPKSAGEAAEPSEEDFDDDGLAEFEGAEAELEELIGGTEEESLE